MNKKQDKISLRCMGKIWSDRTGQESRNDLMVWYFVAFAVVFVGVFALYGFGFIGDGISNGELIESNRVTAAAIAVPAEGNQLNETFNDSEKNIEVNKTAESNSTQN